MAPSNPDTTFIVVFSSFVLCPLRRALRKQPPTSLVRKMEKQNLASNSELVGETCQISFYEYLFVRISILFQFRICRDRNKHRFVNVGNKLYSNVGDSRRGFIFDIKYSKYSQVITSPDCLPLIMHPKQAENRRNVSIVRQNRICIRRKARKKGGNGEEEKRAV